MSTRQTLIYPAQIEGNLQVKAADGQVDAFSPDIHGRQSYDLVLPGQMLRIYAHELPKMREREKAAAARFAIEDRTATALEGQHIVIGPAQDARLAVIDESALRVVLTKLESQGLDIGDIYADFDWAAPQDAPIKLSDRIIFTGREGYTIDPEWADDDLADIPLSNWASLSPRGGALSLRQGEFAPRNKFNLPFASLSKIAALLVITGFSWLTLQWAGARAVQKQTVSLKMQTAELYTQSTGQAAPANPALALTRAVKSSPKSGANFQTLLAELNTVLAETDNIAIQTLTFDEAKSQLSLRLIYPSFESAGALEQAANRSGTIFRAGGVREQNGELIGEAVFEIGDPS